MPKSRKRVRASVRAETTQKTTVTYTFDDDLDLWFAVVISHGKLLNTVDGETIEETLEDVNSFLKTINIKNADHLIDRTRTPVEKQVFAIEYLQSKLF